MTRDAAEAPISGASIGLFYLYEVTNFRLNIACDDDSITYGGSCYILSPCEATCQYFINELAKAFCNIRGFHLVYIGSASEEDFLRTHTDARSKGYWIGLTTDSEENPIWLDNSPLTYRHFTNHSFNEGGECFRMVPEEDYAWLDRSCTEGLTYGYICEKEMGKVIKIIIILLRPHENRTKSVDLHYKEPEILATVLTRMYDIYSCNNCSNDKR